MGVEVDESVSESAAGADSDAIVSEGSRLSPVELSVVGAAAGSLASGSSNVIVGSSYDASTIAGSVAVVVVGGGGVVSAVGEGVVGAAGGVDDDATVCVGSVEVGAVELSQ